jgi:hypothetical protein
MGNNTQCHNQQERKTKIIGRFYFRRIDETTNMHIAFDVVWLNRTS